tara:strand:- start:1877 stop:2302 length:426 start_codon:yes stop_codon:yes gene_type:complete
MEKKTNAQLKKIIREHKKTNCPAFSNKKKSDLLSIINKLNLNKSDTKPKKKIIITKPKPKPKPPPPPPPKKTTKPKTKPKTKQLSNKDKEQDFINKKDEIKKQMDKKGITEKKLDQLNEKLENLILKEKEHYRKKFDTYNF